MRNYLQRTEKIQFCGFDDFFTNFTVFCTFLTLRIAIATEYGIVIIRYYMMPLKSNLTGGITYDP